jgi:hypothetical protein
MMTSGIDGRVSLYQKGRNHPVRTRSGMARDSLRRRPGSGTDILDLISQAFYINRWAAGGRESAAARNCLLAQGVA